MADTGIDRKVRRLDNDVNEIYGTLSGIAETQQKHSTALADLSVAATGIRGTQQRQYNRLDELDGRLDELQGGLTDVRATLARHGNRLDTLETRFDTLETRFDGLETRFDRMDVKFTGMFAGLDAKLNKVLDRLGPPAAEGEG